VEATQASILVIRGGAIGDFILTLPVLSALRQHFPTVRIEVLGYPHIAQLATVGGLAEQVRSIEAGPLAGFFARNGNLDVELQEYFARFSIIISFLYDPDSIFQTNVARCSKAQFIAGPHRPDEKGDLHASQVFLRPLERLAIFGADSLPRIWPLETSVRNPCTTGVSMLALQPGSGSERKNWPEAKWAELLQQLICTTTLKLLLVGGEAEKERLARLKPGLPVDRIEVAEDLPLTELARRLGNCAAFIGHDSGITHLAAAVGISLLVLWGDSVEAIWRPQGKNVLILKSPRGLQAISVRRVMEHLREMPVSLLG
jgi:heptosyltransferase-3